MPEEKGPTPVKDLRQLTMKITGLIGRYKNTDETVDFKTAKDLVELLKPGQHLVPPVMAYCVGYTYDPRKDFRPGKFAAFYGCLDKDQAEAVLEVFTRKYKEKRTGNDTCEIKKQPIEVWSIIDPKMTKAQIEEHLRDLFR